MYNWRRYRCGSCNDTFPIYEKLPVTEDSTNFYCPLCMEAIQEPLVFPKQKDNCLKLRILFFAFILAHSLVKFFDLSISAVNLNLNSVDLSFIPLGIACILLVFLLICSKKNPPIIDTEKSNTKNR